MENVSWASATDVARIPSPAIGAAPAESALSIPLTDRTARTSADPLPWRRNTSLVSTIGLVIADVVALLVSGGLAIVLRNFIWGPMPLPQGIVETGAAWILLRFWAGLYPGFGLSPLEELRKSTTTTAMAAMVHTAALFGLKSAAVSRFSVFVTWTVLALVSWAIRGGCKALLITLHQFGAPVIIAGAGASGAQLVSDLRSTPSLGLVPVAFFDDDPAKHGRTVRGIPVLGPVDQALRERFRYPVRHAIIAMPGLDGRKLARTARALSTRYGSLGVMRDLFGLVDLSLRPRSFGTHLALEVRNNLLDPVNLWLKRLFDLAVALPLALLTLPLILVAGLIVRLVSPGSAFFVQEREGLAGRRIRVWKIRTMVSHAEALLKEHLEEHEEARAEWARYMKLRNDPRVIPVLGHLLRRFSIDELPQLWNIVKGEMSLVGPRPFPQYHLAQFPEAFRSLRRQALPGMTGLWQITCRSEGEVQQQEQMDSFYIRNWSLWIDLWVLLQTVRVVLSGRGAY